MLLDENEIVKLLRKPASAAAIAAGRQAEERHRLHVDGDKALLDKFLVQQTELESKETYALRKRISGPATKPLYASLSKFLNKVFSAWGANFYYTFPSPETQQSFEEWMNDTRRYGMGMREYIESMYKKHCLTGFQGAFFIDIPADGEEPTVLHIPSDRIYDQQTTGHRVDYLIITEKQMLEIGGKLKEETVYLVTDDQYHRRYIRQKQKSADEPYLLIERIEHGLGFVPACPVTLFTEGATWVTRTSILAPSIELADILLRDNSEHELNKKLHAFAQKWSYGVECTHELRYAGTDPETGEIQYQNLSCTDGWMNPIGANRFKCPRCGGEGKYVPVGPDKTYMLAVPDGVTNTFDARDPAGYIVPDIKSIEYLKLELERHELKIEKSVLGKEGVLAITTKQATATEKELDMDPAYELLRINRDNAEFVVKFCVDTLALLRHGSGTASIKYGEKYFLKSVTQLEEELKAARDAGMASSSLYGYVEEIMLTRFKDDPKELERQLIRLQLDPFPTESSDKVMNLVQATPEDKTMSLYLNSYIERFERENGDISEFGRLLQDEKERMNAIRQIIEGYNKEKLSAVEAQMQKEQEARIKEATAIKPPVPPKSIKK